MFIIGARNLLIEKLSIHISNKYIPIDICKTTIKKNMIFFFIFFLSILKTNFVFIL